MARVTGREGRLRVCLCCPCTTMSAGVKTMTAHLVAVERNIKEMAVARPFLTSGLAKNFGPFDGENVRSRGVVGGRVCAVLVQQ